MLDIIVLYTYSLEEHAGQALSIIEWQMTNRFQFFNINAVSIDEGTKQNSTPFLKRASWQG